MDDLAAFLTARLNEDERELVNDPPHGLGYANLAARMRREVEAKRAILTEHDPCYPVYYPAPSGQPTCGVCHSGGFDWEPERWPCATVRALAAVWSDHPVYRPEWKP